MPCRTRSGPTPSGPGVAEAPATLPTRPTPPCGPASWSTRPATALIPESRPQREPDARRYYASRRLIIGQQDRRDPGAWRLPAAELERAVGTAVAHHIRGCLDQHRLVSEPSPQIKPPSQRRGGRPRLDDAASTGMGSPGPRGAHPAGPAYLTLDRAAVAAALAIDPAAIAGVALSIETPFPLRRRGMEARIVTGLELPSVDRVLCRAVARALAWMDQVRAGASIAAIEGVSKRLHQGPAAPCAAVAANRRRARAGPATGLAQHRAPRCARPCHPIGTSKPPARL